ncbi:hypothetical protein A2U01_0032592, partial [Trifolium medium]|nr:hypothetical protein [Trifolium medium]
TNPNTAAGFTLPNNHHAALPPSLTSSVQNLTLCRRESGRRRHVATIVGGAINPLTVATPPYPYELVTVG